MPKTKTTNRPLSTAEAAKIIGITESLIRRYIRNKKLKATRLGERSWSIYREDLEKFQAVRAEKAKA